MGWQFPWFACDSGHLRLVLPLYPEWSATAGEEGHCHFDPIASPFYTTNSPTDTILPPHASVALSIKKSPIMEQRPPFPPFTAETAAQKVQLAEDAWNTRNPEKVALAYTPDTEWRNRTEF